MNNFMSAQNVAKMNLDEVRAAIKNVMDKIEELKLEKEIFLVRLRALQDKCPHPRGESYRDRAGDHCFSCPDCGQET